MRVAAVTWCAAIPGLQVYLFRRIRDDLVKNHMEGPKGFRSMLAGWVACGFCEIVEDEIRFWNGARIYLCHCKDEKDIYKYQGAEIHVLVIDELTHFTEAMYRFLRNRVRMVGIVLPKQYAKKFPRIVCGANPGNIGHLWVKTTFIDSAPPMTVQRMSRGEGGMLRQFIPALLEDNPSMADDDPEYEARLEGLGSETLVRAMRYGDWNVVEGAYFDCWSPKMVIRPFAFPDHWMRFRSGDWGSAKPFSIGWWGVASEDYLHQDGFIIPRGAMVRYREWYGMKPGQPNVGLKITSEQIARGIRERELYESTEEGMGIRYGVLDPSSFASDDGPSKAERMATEGVHWIKADNKRTPQAGKSGGWDAMRARMIGVDGRPMIYVFNTCVDSIRTIPVLMHDKTTPEDLDSDGEDHAADEWRYACMSRPWTAPKPEKKKPRVIQRDWTDEEEAEESWKTL